MPNSRSQSLNDVFAASGYNVNRLKDGKKLVLITGHRRENVGGEFISMCRAIKTLTEQFPEVDFISYAP